MFKVGPLRPIRESMAASNTPKPVTLVELRQSTADLADWRGQVASRYAQLQADTTLARMRRRRDTLAAKFEPTDKR